MAHLKKLELNLDYQAQDGRIGDHVREPSVLGLTNSGQIKIPLGQRSGLRSREKKVLTLTKTVLHCSYSSTLSDKLLRLHDKKRLVTIGRYIHCNIPN